MSTLPSSTSQDRFPVPIRNWSIRHKLIANSLATSTLALLLTGILLIAFEVHQTRLNVANELSSIGEMLGNNSTAPLIFNDREAADRTVKSLRAIQRIASAGIARADGSWFAVYTRSDLRPAPLPRPIGSDGYRFERNEVVLFRTLIVDGEKVGTIYLRSDMTEVLSKLKQYGLLLAIVMITASLVSFFVATVLQRSIYGPLSQLASVAHQVSANKNYRTRAVKTSEDELGVLVDAFNGMLDQVEHRDRELEEKVADRTSELTVANRDLTVARDRAEESARLKSEFLANMSHEIRSPMNVIIGMTQIALDTQLTPKQNRYLSLVRNSAESLLTIINDILDFSKIEAGKMEVESVEFGLAERLAETILPLVVKAREKGLDLQLRMEPDLPGQVMGDPIRLGQIIINLISNAIKFTAKGKIELLARLEKGNTARSVVRFTVSDTGIGIDPDKQNIIFAPFRQSDGSITRHYGGTGLGLSISRHLVEIMGGQIWLESVPGQGSSFHFTIEFANPVRREVPAPAVPRGGKARAIILEPDEARRTALSAMLEAWNIEAAVVDRVSTALDVMRWTARLDRPFAFALVSLAAAVENDSFLLGSLQRDPSMAMVPLIVIGDPISPPLEYPDIEPAAWLNWPVTQSDVLEAVFRFLRPSVSPDQELGGRPRRNGPQLQILVAEDIPANQELLIALFEKRGDTLTLVNNGHEAIEAYRTASFDVVLMDVQMPGMDGVAASRVIREIETSSGKHTPIIALTAHAMKGDRERYLACGMDSYVTKPVRAEQLFREVDRWTSPSAGGVSGEAATPAPADCGKSIERKESYGQAGPTPTPSTLN